MNFFFKFLEFVISLKKNKSPLMLLLLKTTNSPILINYI